MVFYHTTIKKLIKKNKIPKRIIKQLHNAFLALDLTKDLSLFDIKLVKGDYSKKYYRLRKGKYRAIFYIEDDNIYVIFIGKREEVYESWL
jgi:mRNA interferase RelE/StbE